MRVGSFGDDTFEAMLADCADDFVDGARKLVGKAEGGGRRSEDGLQ